MGNLAFNHNVIQNEAKCSEGSRVHPPPTSEAMLSKMREGPASLFCREAEVLFGALKTKSCLSVSEFFLFSVEKQRSRQKSADGEFSLFRFFSSGKRNEKPCGLSESSFERQRVLFV